MRVRTNFNRNVASNVMHLNYAQLALNKCFLKCSFLPCNLFFLVSLNELKKNPRGNIN